MVLLRTLLPLFDYLVVSDYLLNNVMSCTSPIHFFGTDYFRDNFIKCRLVVLTPISVAGGDVV